MLDMHLLEQCLTHTDYVGCPQSCQTTFKPGSFTWEPRISRASAILEHDSSNHAEWASLAVRDAGEEEVLRMDGGFWDSLVLKLCDFGN